MSSEIRGFKFHSVEMVRNSSGIDLEAALSFQKLYVQVICDALSACFVDNNVVDAFKILNPSNMP